MQRFKSATQAQRFLSSHGMIYGHFRPRRHLMSASGYRRARVKAFRIWRQETCTMPGYATISAPVTGRIGRALVTKGNLVGPGTGPLALVVSQDPMFVTFSVSQRELLRIRQEGGSANRENVLVKLRFADGSAYDQTGKIDFVDVAVDRSTDTIIVRACVPNPDSVLVADQFVRVSVVGETTEGKW